AQAGKVAAGATAVLEDAGLAHPQIHDAAFVDQIIGDRLDKASVRRWAFISGSRTCHFSRRRLDEPMSLRGAVDAVSPVQSSVEPLWTVRRGQLIGQHVTDFVEERASIDLRREVAAFPAPISPAAGKPAKDLTRVVFLTSARITRGRPGALQPIRHA